MVNLTYTRSQQATPKTVRSKVMDGLMGAASDLMSNVTAPIEAEHSDMVRSAVKNARETKNVNVTPDMAETDFGKGVMNSRLIANEAKRKMRKM